MVACEINDSWFSGTICGIRAYELVGFFPLLIFTSIGCFILLLGSVFIYEGPIGKGIAWVLIGSFFFFAPICQIIKAWNDPKFGIY